jgi:hypothetical protein
MVQTFLSFDVGTRNLAYCLLSFSVPNVVASCEIVEWEVLDLGGASAAASKEKCALRLTRLLNERFAFLRADAAQPPAGKPATLDYVLIEAQPSRRSGIMVAVQMFLCEYFTMLVEDQRVKRVAFVSPRVKLNDSGLLPPPVDPAAGAPAGEPDGAPAGEPDGEPDGEPAGAHKRMRNGPDDAASTSDGGGAGTSTAAAKKRASARKARPGSWKRYNSNKCQTVNTTQYLLRDVIMAHDKLIEFNAAPKRDDLADAFMQCVGFFVNLSRKR